MSLGLLLLKLRRFHISHWSLLGQAEEIIIGNYIILLISNLRILYRSSVIVRWNLSCDDIGSSWHDEKWGQQAIHAFDPWEIDEKL